MNSCHDGSPAYEKKKGLISLAECLTVFDQATKLCNPILGPDRQQWPDGHSQRMLGKVTLMGTSKEADIPSERDAKSNGTKKKESRKYGASSVLHIYWLKKPVWERETGRSWKQRESKEAIETEGVRAVGDGELNPGWGLQVLTAVLAPRVAAALHIQSRAALHIQSAAALHIQWLIKHKLISGRSLASR